MSIVPQNTNQNTAVATNYQSMMAQMLAAAASIGGDITANSGPTFRYINVLQALSPAVVNNLARVGQLQITGLGEEQPIFTNVIAGFVVDIIGAPGKAGNVNRVQRKLWYDQEEAEARTQFGDGPHCGSVNGINPNPNFVEKYTGKTLLDTRIPAQQQTVMGQRGYNTPNDLIPFHRNVPFQANCDLCALSQWFRSPDGSDVKAPLCDANYKALLWVTQVSGMPEWEPQLCVFEGKGQSGRTFYSTVKGDAEFQKQHELAALFDVAYPAPSFATKYTLVAPGDEDQYMVTPLIMTAAAAKNAKGQVFYVSRWDTLKRHVMIADPAYGTEKAIITTMDAFMKTGGDAVGALATEAARKRFPNGVANTDYAAMLQEMKMMVGTSVLGTHRTDHANSAIMQGALNKNAEYHTEKAADGITPVGRLAFTTYHAPQIEPSDNATVGVDAATPSSAPTAHGAVPVRPDAAATNVVADASTLTPGIDINLPEDGPGWSSAESPTDDENPLTLWGNSLRS